MGLPDDEGGTAGGRVLQRMLAGGMAGMTSTSLLFPLDNLTTRLATSGTRGVASLTLNGVAVPVRGVGGIVRGMKLVVKTEGVKSLYRGRVWQLPLSPSSNAVCILIS